MSTERETFPIEQKEEGTQTHYARFGKVLPECHAY